jgi:hypothetical protein
LPHLTLLELKTLGGLKKELNNALTIILRLEKQSLVFVQLKKKDKHTALIVLIAQAEANKQRNLPPKMWTIQKLNKFEVAKERWECKYHPRDQISFSITMETVAMKTSHPCPCLLMPKLQIHIFYFFKDISNVILLSKLISSSANEKV